MVERRSNKKNSLKIFEIIVFLFFLVLIYFALFIKIEFNDMAFEQLLFTLTNPSGANYDIVWRGFLIIGGCVLLTLLVLFILKKIYDFFKISVVFKLKVKNKEFKFDVFKITKLRKRVFFILYIIFSLIISIKMMAIDDYIKAQIVNSTIFEDYYVSGEDVNVKFPDKKRNLIYIWVESMESANFSYENGGLTEVSYTPELEKLALSNTNFSGSSSGGGARQLSGTGYTIAALVSQTSGVPLKVPIDWNYYNGYSESLPGLYNLGDILEENGYKNYFMLGSDASYGGRRDYFVQHGNYEIFDYYWAIEEGKISKDYYEWWGYEDAKLFEYAKEKLLEISKNDEPFNFTMLTADTHFIDGYLDDSCKNKFDSVYANAFYCSDSKLGAFIKWIKKQKFYKNTTIVVVGDHLTMQSDFYANNDFSRRNIYNTFINSAVNANREKNRVFSSFDLFPTTLASLGAEIEGEQIGFGVNLYSDKDTLVEQLGEEYLNEELAKKSFFYDEVILGDSYYEMVKGRKKINE